MSKPHVHAKSSARRFGGQAEDYIDIHELLDNSKSTVADQRHRALTHNAWFLSQILPRIFGNTRMNSDGKVYSVRDVGELHVLEDYGGRFIPSAQDFLCEMEFKDWVQNGQGSPPSTAKIVKRKQYVLQD